MSKPQDNANAYLRTQVMSASPAELRMMLLDGAVKFARQGRQGLADKNHEQVYSGFSQARAIVTELMTSMRHDVAPELCESVRSLYAYIFQELVSASLESDIDKADKVIGLLEFEAETWRLLMDKLRTEEAPAVGAAPVKPNKAAYAPASESKPAPAYTPLSIEG